MLLIVVTYYYLLLNKIILLFGSDDVHDLVDSVSKNIKKVLKMHHFCI